MTHAKDEAALLQENEMADGAACTYAADIGGRSKPHPALYLAAANGFGVAPVTCAAIEDSRR